MRCFIGLKMLLEPIVHVPIWASLLFIAVALTGTIVYSLRATEDEPPQPPEDTGIPLPPPLDFKAPSSGNGHTAPRVRK